MRPLCDNYSLQRVIETEQCLRGSVVKQQQLYLYCTLITLQTDELSVLRSTTEAIQNITAKPKILHVLHFYYTEQIQT